VNDTIAVAWAVWGKSPDSRLGYHIVRASGDADEHAALARLVPSLLPGSPEHADTDTGGDSSLPWVTFGAAPGENGAVAVCVTSKATEPDEFGRRLSRTLVYLFPPTELAENRAGFAALWRSVKYRPVPDGTEPLFLRITPQPWAEIAAEIEQDGIFDWCATAAATLLERPVAITTRSRIGPDRASTILDAISGLLPYGYRTSISAGTSVDGMTDHRLRLVFAPYGQHDAVEIPYPPDSDRDPAAGLGDVGRAFLRELRDLRRDEAGSVRGVIEIMNALTARHTFGPADIESRWAVSVLHDRNPLRSTIRAITDGREHIPQDTDGRLSPSVADPRYRSSVERLLTTDTLPSATRLVCYEYLARGPFPEHLPTRHWPDAVDAVADVVHESLSRPGADDEFGVRVADRFIDAAPPDIRDELVARLLNPGGAGSPAEHADALLAALARHVVRWTDALRTAEPGGGHCEAAQESLGGWPELVYRTLEYHLDDPAATRRLLDLLDSAPERQPRLRLVHTVLSPEGRVDSAEVISADAARPGLAELLMAVAQTLGRTDTAISALWPALLRGAVAPWRRAEISRRMIGAVRGRRRDGTPDDGLDARIDALLLLAGDRRFDRLAMAAQLDIAGLSGRYLDSLQVMWREPATEDVRDRVATLLIVSVIALAGGPSGPVTRGLVPAVDQVLRSYGDDIPAPVVDVLVQARNSGTLAVDDLSEEFWAGLGNRYRELTDQHWTSTLRRAGDTDNPEPIATLWSRLVTAGFTPSELLAALGPWPRARVPADVLPMMVARSQLYARWSALTESLIAHVTLPDGFSPEQVSQHRAELRALLISGAWGKSRATALLRYQTDEY